MMLTILFILPLLVLSRFSPSIINIHTKTSQSKLDQICQAIDQKTEEDLNSDIYNSLLNFRNNLYNSLLLNEQNISSSSSHIEQTNSTNIHTHINSESLKNNLLNNIDTIQSSTNTNTNSNKLLSIKGGKNNKKKILILMSDTGKHSAL